MQNLHFELCYYQAIDAAIEMGLERVEAGAQVRPCGFDRNEPFAIARSQTAGPKCVRSKTVSG